MDSIVQQFLLLHKNLNHQQNLKFFDALDRPTLDKCLQLAEHLGGAFLYINGQTPEYPHVTDATLKEVLEDFETTLAAAKGFDQIIHDTKAALPAINTSANDDFLRRVLKGNPTWGFTELFQACDVSGSLRRYLKLNQDFTREVDDFVDSFLLEAHAKKGLLVNATNKELLKQFLERNGLACNMDNLEKARQTLGDVFQYQQPVQTVVVEVESKPAVRHDYALNQTEFKAHSQKEREAETKKPKRFEETQEWAARNRKAEQEFRRLVSNYAEYSRGTGKVNHSLTQDRRTILWKTVDVYIHGKPQPDFQRSLERAREQVKVWERERSK